MPMSPSHHNGLRFSLGTKEMASHGLSPLFALYLHSHRSHDAYPTCYGRLAVMSDVDDGGFALNVDNESEGLLCYNEASTTERC
jgi:hypothetical protein